MPRLDRAVHRVTGGHLLMSQAMIDCLILTTHGRRTGLPRSVPLACLADPDGRFLVVASNFGRQGSSLAAAAADMAAVRTLRGILRPGAARFPAHPPHRSRRHPASGTRPKEGTRAAASVSGNGGPGEQARRSSRQPAVLGHRGPPGISEPDPVAAVIHPGLDILDQPAEEDTYGRAIR